MIVDSIIFSHVNTYAEKHICRKRSRTFPENICCGHVLKALNARIIFKIYCKPLYIIYPLLSFNANTVLLTDGLVIVTYHMLKINEKCPFSICQEDTKSHFHIQNL